jgi:hypothetical protein
MKTALIVKRNSLCAALAIAFAIIITTNGHSRAFEQDQKLTPAEILSAAAENGKQLQAELRTFTYYSELTIETISQSETITGKFYRFSVISFDRSGNRQEKILDNTSTLPDDIHIGTNAANNLVRVYQFILSPETLDQYDLSYVGRERVDDLSTYVFDVRPKVRLPDPDKSSERYLKGRIWIDDGDLCVVKVSGEALPEQSAHRTPRFETYYQNYGRYWFPAYVSADDLVRVGRRSMRVMVKARFTSYKKAR